MMSFKNSYERNSRNYLCGSRDKSQSGSYNSIKSLASKDSALEGFKALNGKTTLNLDPSAVASTSSNPAFRHGEQSSLKSLQAYRAAQLPNGNT